MPTTIEIAEDAATGFERSRVRGAPLTRRAARRPDDQPVLSIRASVPEAEAERFIADALRDIRVFMHEHQVAPAGPPFAISRPHRNDLDVEAGWPTDTPLGGTSRIHSGSLPRSLTGPRARPSLVDATERRGYVLQP